MLGRLLTERNAMRKPDAPGAASTSRLLGIPGA